MRVLFFFKRKTAYEMRISDWSSDVCSSDLDRTARRQGAAADQGSYLPAFGTGRQPRCRSLRHSAERFSPCGSPELQPIIALPKERNHHDRYCVSPHFVTADRKSTRLNSSH